VKADRARLLAAAAAGVVVAHAADYALAFPDPAHRGRELAATGHGYWPMAVLAAAALGGVAVVLAARRGLGAGVRTASSSVPFTAARLAAAQLLFFCVLETVERLATGVDPVPFLHSPQLVVGLALQVAVAIAAAVVLRGVEAGAGRVATASRRPTARRGPAPSWARARNEPVARGWGTTGDARGPPLLVHS
jgi:hypothetical protein